MHLLEGPGPKLDDVEKRAAYRIQTHNLLDYESEAAALPLMPVDFLPFRILISVSFQARGRQWQRAVNTDTYATSLS